MKFKKNKDKLEIGNLLICVLKNSPHGGIVGETNLHLLIYRLFEDGEFNELKIEYPFVIEDGKPFSPSLHNALFMMARDYGSMKGKDSKSTETGFIPSILYNLEIEDYDKVSKSEKWASKYAHEEIHPYNFTLTPNGATIAMYTWEMMLKPSQKDAVLNVTRDFFRV